MPAPIDIVAGGASWVVVDKPAGMLSVPGKGPGKADCTIARVREMFPGAIGPMVVHRLDMDTSGLLLVALTPAAQRALSMQFEARTVHKRYIAVVEGAPRQASGVVRLRQRLDINHRPVQILDDEQGKAAETRWRVIESTRRGAGVSLARACVEFEPVTGRSHQIRLAAATPTPVGLGCPIIGDDLYGSGRADTERMLLAAVALAFTDPETSERVVVEIPAPF